MAAAPSLTKGKSFEGKSLKRPVQEVRAEIRSYIRNERDTVLKRWMALNETIRSEDRRRDQFYKRKFVEDTKSLPLNVLKFIGTLKKAVRNTMRDKGGTPYSIVRSLFIYWDADRSGFISANELFACMKSLGVKISMNECQEIVNFYSPGASLSQTVQEIEMDYRDLLMDLQRGEPSIIQFVTQEEDEQRDMKELRFEEIGDQKILRPAIVDKFLEAVRQYLQVKMRDEGGTPQQHIRFLFSFYDYDYSNGLDPHELMVASRRAMKLAMNEEQAKAIVDYYDRKKAGQMTYDKFVGEVCADVKPILYFPELTAEVIEEKKKSLEKNPFIPRPFQSIPNKVLEKFKAELRKVLIARISKQGGSIGSWIREAFSVWDRHFSCRINDPKILQGAAKRLGVSISEDDARIIMKCYDPQHTGEMLYTHLIQEMAAEDEHFLNDGSGKQGFNRFTHYYEKPWNTNSVTAMKNTSNGNTATTNTTITNTTATTSFTGPETMTPTSRTPSNVNVLLNRMKRAIEAFITKSKGKLSNPVDILHGTILRFDPHHTGKLSGSSFSQVLQELKIPVDSPVIEETILWFDTDGSHQIEYNLLIKQIFGEDFLLEKFNLQDYQIKLKQLKQNRRAQLRRIDQLKKDDNTVTLKADPWKHALGHEKIIQHPKHLPHHPHYKHVKKGSKGSSVNNLLATIALNRSQTMKSLPTSTEVLLRPSSAAGGEPSRESEPMDSGNNTNYNLSVSRSLPNGDHPAWVKAVQDHIPKRFVTDTSSSQAGSLLLDPSTVQSNPYITTMTENNLLLPTEYGVRSDVRSKNLVKQQGMNELAQQIKTNRQKILSEKKKVEKKLLLVEEQRKSLMDEFKSKHSKEAVKTLLNSLRPVSSSQAI